MSHATAGSAEVAVEVTGEPLAELVSSRTPTWFVRGYVVFHTLFALAEVGFFEHLSRKGAVDSKGFAAARNLDGEILEALARYLYGLGVLDAEGPGRWVAAAEVGDTDLALVRMFFAYDPLFHNLTDLLRKQKTYGREVRRDPRLDAEASGRICRRFSYPRLVEVVRRRRARYVLDLGCGSGELLIALARGCPGVQGLGVDRSREVVGAARQRLAAEQLGDRIRVEVGDILDLAAASALAAEPARPIDLIISSAVFHEFAHPHLDGLVRALEEVRRCFPGVPLVLAEALEQEDEALRETASHALEHHLFHRLSRQGIARGDTWHPAFARAGYRLAETLELAPGGVIFVLEAEARGDRG